MYIYEQSWVDLAVGQMKTWKGAGRLCSEVVEKVREMMRGRADSEGEMERVETLASQGSAH